MAEVPSEIVKRLLTEDYDTDNIKRSLKSAWISVDVAFKNVDRPETRAGALNKIKWAMEELAKAAALLKKLPQKSKR